MIICFSIFFVLNFEIDEFDSPKVIEVNQISPGDKVTMRRWYLRFDDLPVQAFWRDGYICYGQINFTERKYQKIMWCDVFLITKDRLNLTYIRYIIYLNLLDLIIIVYVCCWLMIYNWIYSNFIGNSFYSVIFLPSLKNLIRD